MANKRCLLRKWWTQFQTKLFSGGDSMLYFSCWPPQLNPNFISFFCSHLGGSVQHKAWLYQPRRYSKRRARNCWRDCNSLPRHLWDNDGISLVEVLSNPRVAPPNDQSRLLIPVSSNRIGCALLLLSLNLRIAFNVWELFASSVLFYSASNLSKKHYLWPSYFGKSKE